MEVDFLTAIKYRKELLKVCCSYPWIEEIVPSILQGESCQYLPEIYPPMGMRTCPECNRICPPNGAAGSPCCDCEIEGDELVFRESMEQPDKRALAGLWWPTFLAYDYIENRWYTRSTRSYAEFMYGSTTELLRGLSIEQDDAEASKEEEGISIYLDNLADPPTTSDESQQISSYIDPHISIKIVQNRLNQPKKEKGRCSGCQVLLLPESEEALLKEITHFEAKGRLLPSTQRYSRHNPYLPAPEDYDSWATISEETCSEAFDIDYEDAWDWVNPRQWNS